MKLTLLEFRHLLCSSIGLSAFAGVLILSGCDSTVQTGAFGTETSTTTLTSKTIDGSGDSAPAGSDTSVTLTPPSKYAWNSVLIDLGDDFSGSNICSGKIIFGRTGSGVCQDSSGGTNSTAANVLAGTYFWNSSGTSTVGTMTNHGALNINTTAIPGSSSGFYSSIVSTLTAGDLCTGKSIFGSAGTAACNSVFGELTGSNAFHTTGSVQLTTNAEINRGSCSTVSFTTRQLCESNGSTWTPTALPAGYHQGTDVLTDDDGLWTGVAGCTGSGGSTDTCSTAIPAAPTVDCGTTQPTIQARIDDCASVGKNGTTATWNGDVNGLNGEGTWKLVTKKSGYEVWRDERTSLLWSDTDGITYNWCYAAGNKQADDPSGICNDPTNQDQTTPFSACTEIAGSQGVFSGDDYVGGTYSDMKGGMGKLSGLSIAWRLPTRNDFALAEVNGAHLALPGFGRITAFAYYWTSTLVSDGRDDAWQINGQGVVHPYGSRSNTSTRVRCVGR